MVPNFKAIANITTSPRVAHGVPIDCLVVVSESERRIGKEIADGRADTLVICTG